MQKYQVINILKCKKSEWMKNYTGKNVKFLRYLNIYFHKIHHVYFFVCPHVSGGVDWGITNNLCLKFIWDHVERGNKPAVLNLSLSLQLCVESELPYYWNLLTTKVFFFFLNYVLGCVYAVYFLPSRWPQLLSSWNCSKFLF